VQVELRRPLEVHSTRTALLASNSPRRVLSVSLSLLVGQYLLCDLSVLRMRHAAELAFATIAVAEHSLDSSLSQARVCLLVHGGFSTKILEKS